MVNSVVIVGLSLIASMLIAYGRIFRSKKTIMKESQTDGHQNIHEIRHRLLETRIAQIGAALLSIGFALQLTGNFMDYVRSRSLLLSIKFERGYYSDCSSWTA
jgi:hypothetical protein